ncbi:MAG: hypothetical protein IPG02_10170 [Ignavibacteria bacterium]|nr:hypothetical protein [Ignavibacteria bacterium]
MKKVNFSAYHFFDFLIMQHQNLRQKNLQSLTAERIPNYDYVTNSTNWSWYDELNVNLWQGWGIGEVSIHGFILDSLYSRNISGYFQPDTLMQFALGKVITHQAENNTTDSFRYRHHNLGKDTTETFMGETVTCKIL